jgi:hypothetical protein
VAMKRACSIVQRKMVLLPMKSSATDPALAAAILVIAALIGLGAGAMGYFVVAAFRGG